MDQLQAMKVFTAVVDAGSFVGAVNALDLSKPAVSRQVAELEAHLGTRLLQRTTRRLSLTEAGERYYLRSKDILSAVDEADADVAGQLGQARGRLRVSVPQSFGTIYLAGVWSGFMRAHPQVLLDIEHADRMVDLVEEGYDAAIRIGRPADSGLVGRTLATARLVLCASPDYLAAHGEPKQPAELAHHAALAYSYFRAGTLWRFQGPGGEESVRVKAAAIANSGEVCRAMALTGCGVILSPDFIIWDDLANKRLIRLMPEYDAGQLDIQILYPTRKLLPLKVRALIDYLADALRAPPWNG